jgi:hypothetical protein
VAERCVQTSGLDANTARNVMEALREIARSGYDDFWRLWHSDC